VKPFSRSRRSVCGVAAAVLLSVVPFASTANSASADTSLFDVTGFRTTNVVVSSNSCKYVPVTMQVTQSPQVALSNTITHVYKGSQEVDTAWLEPNVSKTWLWCPYLDGYGTFTFGPTDVDVALEPDYSEYTATDYTRATVKVKARGVTSVKATRSGRYVTVLATSSFYNFNASGYSRLRGVRVSVQYRLPGTTTWKTVTTKYSNTSGQVSARVYSPHARYWRAVLGESGQAFGAVSASAAR